MLLLLNLKAKSEVTADLKSCKTVDHLKLPHISPFSPSLSTDIDRRHESSHLVREDSTHCENTTHHNVGKDSTHL